MSTVIKKDFKSTVKKKKHTTSIHDKNSQHIIKRMKYTKNLQLMTCLTVNDQILSS